ncbi:hypothetical protein Tco_1140519 [Tanacetum coccineum]
MFVLADWLQGAVRPGLEPAGGPHEGNYNVVGPLDLLEDNNKSDGGPVGPHGVLGLPLVSDDEDAIRMVGDEELLSNVVEASV